MNWHRKSLQKLEGTRKSCHSLALAVRTSKVSSQKVIRTSLAFWHPTPTFMHSCLRKGSCQKKNKINKQNTRKESTNQKRWTLPWSQVLHWSFQSTWKLSCTTEERSAFFRKLKCTALEHCVSNRSIALMQKVRRFNSFTNFCITSHPQDGPVVWYGILQKLKKIGLKVFTLPAFWKFSSSRQMGVKIIKRPPPRPPGNKEPDLQGDSSKMGPTSPLRGKICSQIRNLGLFGAMDIFLIVLVDNNSYLILLAWYNSNDWTTCESRWFCSSFSTLHDGRCINFTGCCTGYSAGRDGSWLVRGTRGKNTGHAANASFR